MTNGVTSFNSRGYGYIVKNVESGSTTVIVPDNYEDDKSKQYAIDYINDNILIKKCERAPNEMLIDFIIRLAEVLEEQYTGKANPNCN